MGDYPGVPSCINPTYLEPARQHTNKQGRTHTTGPAKTQGCHTSEKVPISPKVLLRSGLVKSKQNGGLIIYPETHFEGKALFLCKSQIAYPAL